MKIENIDFNKGNGLIPVIIQDEKTFQVLMLGYMNKEALEKTLKENIVTFFSRSKNRLWTKGETSGNFLKVKSIQLDCDSDSLLIQVKPSEETCHKGKFSCFSEKKPKGFLYELEEIIEGRIENKNSESYVYNLYQKGINKVSQKFGEEAMELLIEAKDQDDHLFKNEAADMLFHFMILLKKKDISLHTIETTLFERNRK
ncbi:bifunctional phosphoribosyl-AMP cyclohydrolase/phosphoribosyl-ATP diphosphatase HisIE [Aureivirga sp. CE67]|uniref:bifunctional phosphoribosyl-AMP cyclohydrolase/phosphoribosyl-ATP diphosphatase HisIE n=1 Tax=Aureivirga sp. CE67 TaxID=1788983 RepID=UPI0018C94071|nr:bifunctional phosphoribosyl-AMP cyclohydrolase/phosphoribosyl-ATP diphosphatase HisIE [Aureivirga sp. CE67]